MFELFDNETKEMKSFCEDNNFIAYHSGGGCYHYMLNDSIYTWLVNDDTYDIGIPNSPNDLIGSGLWLDDVIEAYYNSINKDVNYEIKDDIINHLKKLSIKNVDLDYYGNINIENVKFVDMTPSMKKVNYFIQKFLDKENK